MDRQQHTGFILTSQVVHRNQRSYLEFYLVTDSGPVRVLTEPQTFVCFVAQSQAEAMRECLAIEAIRYEHQSLSLTTFNHQAVTAFYFRHQSQLFNARQLAAANAIELYEADIRLTDRYLMERFIRGAMTVEGKWQAPNRLLDAKCRPADYKPQLSVISLDIECSEHGDLYSVGLVSERQSLVIMVDEGMTHSDGDGIRWVSSAKGLLEALVDTIQTADPDLIIGWNVINFDFKVLMEQAKRWNVSLNLGRDGTAISMRQNQSDANQHFVTIAGRLVIDGIDALKTATYSFDSFSLESVAQSMLGEGKAVDDVDTRLAKINHDFMHNKLNLAAYNRKDCELVLAIFEKANLIDYLVLRSTLTGLAMDRVGGSVAAFTNLYLPHLHRSGYVAPNLPADGGLASPGGYVMQSKPGLYKNILVLDFKSLYPSIIRTFKIDPMGLIEGLKNPENAIDGFKEAMFSREHHFLPDIVTELWRQRDIAKRSGDDARSHALKIIMNSFYGVLGSGGCRFYDTRLASSITLRGHEIMQTTAQWIEASGHEVIYGDTDSTFVRLAEDMDAEQALIVGQSLAEDINQRWQTHIQATWNIPCYLELEFETCFEQFFMPTIRGSEAGSKKRYAGTYRKDGKSTMVFKGLESVRSDWTPLAKYFQASLYQKVFDGEDVSAYIHEIVTQTRQGELDHDLVYRKRLRRPLATYQVNVPPHVRAARLADEWYMSQGKSPRYQHRGVIEYVITLAGPQPLEHVTSPLNYEHYVSRQLAPVADAILPFIGLTFNDISNQQLRLF